jgi:LPS export ABC transporter protein LptC
MKQQRLGSKKPNYLNNIFLITALFIGAVILFSGCDNEIEKIKAFSSTENLPVLSAMDFETTFTDSFKVQFFMKAPLLQKFNTDGQPYIEFPKGILLIKYDSEEKIISRITSDYAKQFEKDKKWEAKNNVIAVNAQGDTLKTELLIWEEKAGRIYTDKFVKIIRPNQTITGIGFESDQNLQNWRINKPRGPIYVNVKNEKSSTNKIQPKPEENSNTKKELQFGN